MLHAPYDDARCHINALCEGDDYWTDPLKLQKQVEFMEANSDCVLTYHDRVELKNGEFNKPPNVFPATLTRLHRNLDLEYPFLFNDVLSGDTVQHYMLKLHGKFAFVKDIEPAVKRRDSDGIWNSLSEIEQHNNRVKTYETLLEVYRGTHLQKELERTLAAKRIKRAKALYKESLKLYFKEYFMDDLKNIFRNNFLIHTISSFLSNKFNR